MQVCEVSRELFISRRVKLPVEARMRFRRTRLRVTNITKVLRGLGPLMGLLALGAPLFAQPSAVWSGSSNAPERRLAMGLASDSSSFFHPLVTLLGLAVAGSAACNHVQAHPSTLLGWDALRGTSLCGSIWMVRDRWMGDHRPPRPQASLASLLRC